MAELVAAYMADHGTKFIRQCVPVSVEKDDEDQLHVTWKNLVTDEEDRGTFDTVLFAVGKEAEIMFSILQISLHVVRK